MIMTTKSILSAIREAEMIIPKGYFHSLTITDKVRLIGSTTSDIDMNTLIKTLKDAGVVIVSYKEFNLKSDIETSTGLTIAVYITDLNVDLNGFAHDTLKLIGNVNKLNNPDLIESFPAIFVDRKECHLYGVGAGRALKFVRENKIRLDEEEILSGSLYYKGKSGNKTYFLQHVDTTI